MQHSSCHGAKSLSNGLPLGTFKLQGMKPLKSIPQNALTGAGDWQGPQYQKLQRAPRRSARTVLPMLISRHRSTTATSEGRLKRYQGRMQHQITPGISLLSSVPTTSLRREGRTQLCIWLGLPSSKILLLGESRWQLLSQQKEQKRAPCCILKAH